MSNIKSIITNELAKLEAKRSKSLLENKISSIIKEELGRLVKEADKNSSNIASKLETVRKNLLRDGKISVHEKGSATVSYAARPERRISLETVSNIIETPINELILYFLNGHRIHEGRELVEYRLGHVYFYGESTEIPTKSVNETRTSKLLARIHEIVPTKKSDDGFGYYDGGDGPSRPDEDPSGVKTPKDPYGTGNITPKKSSILKPIKKNPYEATNEDTEAGEEAKKLGLIHKGWGRYADKSGTVTHTSVNGKLVPVQSPEKSTTSKDYVPGQDYGHENIPHDDDAGPIRLANLLKKGHNITTQPSSDGNSIDVFHEKPGVSTANIGTPDADDLDAKDSEGMPIYSYDKRLKVGDFTSADDNLPMGHIEQFNDDGTEVYLSGDDGEDLGWYPVDQISKQELDRE